MKFSILLLLSLALPVAMAKSRGKSRKAAPARSKISMTKVGVCEGAAPDDKKILIIKQWHLPPTTFTKSFKEKYPQERNQTAIYKQLNEEIKAKRIDLVVAEGCEGEIADGFKPAFNGWDLESLKAQAQTRGYEKILTNVPLKLEARHGANLLTLCGDNEALIQEGNLRLSNMRGWVGFLSRLGEKGDAEKLKLYGEAAATLLKEPKDTPPAELQAQIKTRLKEEIDLFRKSLSARNDSFVKTFEGREFKTAALVIGGLHAADLKEKIRAAGYACEVLEPPGYVREDENLIRDFENAIK